jgi:hypothetical protein
MKGGCAVLGESLPLALQPVKTVEIKQVIVAIRKMLFESDAI